MGENFIGSHISLVTKSDLRYEGILTEIDIVESTITLKNVRAFGDEGRRPQAPQPASDKVFELILFKADDIQDLTVITQQAQAPPTPANPTYPAPYNYGAPPPAQPPMAQPPSTYNQGPWGAPPPAANTQPYAPLYGSNQWSVTPAPPSQPPPPAQRAAPPPPPPAAGSTPAVAPTVSIAPKTVPKDTAPPAPPAKPSNWAQAVGGGRGGGRCHAANGSAAAGGAGRGGPAGGRGGPAPPAPGRAPMAPHHVPSRTGVPAGPPGQPRPAPGAAPPIPVPAEEYDFQAANEKFKKDELAKEVEEAAKDPVYKKDDFFDMLSCEALTHRDVTGIDGRARVEQKQRDMETFGGLGGVRHTSFNRGRGRGPMHGGGQGGRGGPMQAGGQGRGYGGGRGGDNRMGGRGGAAGGPGRGGFGGQGRGGGRGGPRQDHR